MRHPALRLIGILMALLIGAGPAGAVTSKYHLCDPAESVLMSELAQTAHTEHRSSDVPEALGEPQNACVDCLDDCCVGGNCSVSACGSGVVALHSGVAMAAVDLSSGVYVHVSLRTLPDFRSALLRPPQI